MYLVKNEIMLISKENAKNKIDIQLKLNKNKIGKIKDKSGKITRYTIELQADAIEPGQTVVIMDDLLATGGTASAAAELIRDVGGVISGASFILELSFLPGRSRLEALGIKTSTLVSYDE